MVPCWGWLQGKFACDLEGRDEAATTFICNCMWARHSCSWSADLPLWSQNTARFMGFSALAGTSPLTSPDPGPSACTVMAEGSSFSCKWPSCHGGFQFVFAVTHTSLYDVPQWVLPPDSHTLESSLAHYPWLAWVTNMSMAEVKGCHLWIRL